MSTVKTDAVTAVSTNADLSLDGLGTGGVSIASTLKMAKGGDISSASPLVIDTDGNYFDVTGTTNFAAMTVESGNFFMLQFDGALTITHGSGIELPGAANLTTATGDRLICYATAANTVEVMSVETEAAAAATGGFTFISNTVISNAATYDFESFDASAYDAYMLIFSNLVPVTDGVHFWARTSTDAGSAYDAGSSDYGWGVHGLQDAFKSTTDDADAQWALTGNTASTNNTVGSAAADKGCSGTIMLMHPHLAYFTDMTMSMKYVNANSQYQCIVSGGATRREEEDVTGFRLLFASGNIETGEVTAYGLKNS
jgi:hypothetical protein